MLSFCPCHMWEGCWSIYGLPNLLLQFVLLVLVVGAWNLIQRGHIQCSFTEHLMFGIVGCYDSHVTWNQMASSDFLYIILLYFCLPFVRQIGNFTSVSTLVISLDFVDLFVLRLGDNVIFLLHYRLVTVSFLLLNFLLS